VLGFESIEGWELEGLGGLQSDQGLFSGKLSRGEVRATCTEEREKSVPIINLLSARDLLPCFFTVWNERRKNVESSHVSVDGLSWVIDLDTFPISARRNRALKYLQLKG